MMRQQAKADAVMQGSGPDEDDPFDLIRNGDLVPSLLYDESVTAHSFVVVNADMNLIFKNMSDVKELICSSCLVLQRTLVKCGPVLW